MQSSFSLGLPELSFLVSCNPQIPLFLYEQRHLFPHDKTRSNPRISTSNPFSSNISLEVLPFSYSTIKSRLNSSVYVIPFLLTALTNQFPDNISISLSVKILLLIF